MTGATRAYLGYVDGRNLDREPGSLQQTVASDLAGADLSQADLGGADLRGAILREANLMGARLDGANLFKAVLEGAELTGCSLRDAKFLNCAQIMIARNWQDADRDEALACGAPIPTREDR